MSNCNKKCFLPFLAWSLSKVLCDTYLNYYCFHHISCSNWNWNRVSRTPRIMTNRQTQLSLCGYKRTQWKPRCCHARGDSFCLPSPFKQCTHWTKKSWGSYFVENVWISFLFWLRFVVHAVICGRLNWNDPLGWL